MTLFQKVGRSANRLFTKYAKDPALFRKISNSARDIDATVQKVGNFQERGRGGGARLIVRRVTDGGESFSGGGITR